MIQYSFKKDKFKSARGGYSRLWNICCMRCNSLVCLYQKDGPGNLRRLYLDRIYSPKKLTNLQNTPLQKITILQCPQCKDVLGTPYIYVKERRKAFRLYQDAVVKKVRKLEQK